jgi:hypothetical protein
MDTINLILDLGILWVCNDVIQSANPSSTSWNDGIRSMSNSMLDSALQSLLESGFEDTSTVSCLVKVCLPQFTNAYTKSNSNPLSTLRSWTNAAIEAGRQITTTHTSRKHPRPQGHQTHNISISEAAVGTTHHRSPASDQIYMKNRYAYDKRAMEDSSLATATHGLSRHRAASSPRHPAASLPRQSAADPPTYPSAGPSRHPAAGLPRHLAADPPGHLAAGPPRHSATGPEHSATGPEHYGSLAGNQNSIVNTSDIETARAILGLRGPATITDDFYKETADPEHYGPPVSSIYMNQARSSDSANYYTTPGAKRDRSPTNDHLAGQGTAAGAKRQKFTPNTNNYPAGQKTTASGQSYGSPANYRHSNQAYHSPAPGVISAEPATCGSRRSSNSTISYHTHRGSIPSMLSAEPAMICGNMTQPNCTAMPAAFSTELTDSKTPISASSVLFEDSASQDMLSRTIRYQRSHWKEDDLLFMVQYLIKHPHAYEDCTQELNKNTNYSSLGGMFRTKDVEKKWLTLVAEVNGRVAQCGIMARQEIERYLALPDRKPEEKQDILHDRVASSIGSTGLPMWRLGEILRRDHGRDIYYWGIRRVVDINDCFVIHDGIVKHIPHGPQRQ